MTGLRSLSLGLAAALALAAGARAEALSTPARHALLVDNASGMVLLDKEADVAMPPASMSKLMTVYMVFKALKAGRLKLDDKMYVSKKAWKMGGSKMFVEVGREVSVKDLLLGVRNLGHARKIFRQRPRREGHGPLVLVEQRRGRSSKVATGPKQRQPARVREPP